MTLGFPEDQGFLRDVAERRRTVLEEGIGAVLGRPVGVRCVATNLDLVPPLPADADAAFVLAEARRIFGTDERMRRPVDLTAASLRRGRLSSCTPAALRQTGLGRRSKLSGA